MANEIQKVQSPYATPVVPASSADNSLAAFAAGANDAVQVAQAAAVAEAIVPNEVAKRFPRDERISMDKLLNACMRQGLAEQAVYDYTRGGTPVSGASIRLAEAAARAWGNLRYGYKEISHDKVSTTCLAYAYDLESNLRAERTFTVSHVRHTKGSKGDYLLTDPRDIYEIVANNAARRIRACILELLPGDVIDAAVAQCEETMKAQADVSPDGVKKMADAFRQKFGVSKAQIEARIQRRLDAITPAQVVALRKIFVSLKDGMSTKDEWFDPNVVDTSATDVKSENADAPSPQKAAPKKRASLVDAAKAALADEAAGDDAAVADLPFTSDSAEG